MAVEAVRNGDGSTKNDCERCAWTRLVPVLASLYRRMKLIVIADGLFSQGTQIRLLQEHGLVVSRIFCNFQWERRPAHMGNGIRLVIIVIRLRKCPSPLYGMPVLC